MRQHLLLESDKPVLAVGSVCHTDSAKAYRNLASPLYDGTLMDFEHLKLGHTCVKHKPPRPEFSKEIQTRVWNGNAFEEQIRYGGTQKLDGFFAGFRRDVGKRALNSAGSSEAAANRMEHLMHCQVRLYQFKYWLGGLNLLQIFGRVREVEKIQPGSLCWTSLEAFKVVQRRSVAQEEVLEDASDNLSFASEHSYPLEGD